MDGDIRKAYDYVSHKAFAEAARENGISEILILAWLREWRSMKSIFRLDADTKSEEIERSRSLPQGDPAAPCLFNITLDKLASNFILLCRRRRWGKKLEDGSWVDIILFADNYWLVAVNPKMLENMTIAWLDLLAEYGWETPIEELTWCTTRNDDVEIKIEVNNKIARRAKAAAGFKVLGTQITFDNSYEVELESRLRKADSAFWANWGLLGCVSVPLVKRLAVFTASVNATMFWCAGTWNLTRAQNGKIRVRQMRLIRRMLRLKRRDGEVMGDFLYRANSSLKHKLNILGTVFETWDIRATQLRFEWGGHVARVRKLDPNRRVLRVSQHWAYGSIVRSIESHNTGGSATTDTFIIGDGNTTCTETSV